jgi:hypothetical protein
LSTFSQVITVPEEQVANSVSDVTIELSPVEKYALGLVQDAHQHCKSINKDQHEEIEKFSKLYLSGKTRKRNAETVADLWPNVYFEAVDTLVPQIYRSLFPDHDFFDVEEQTKDFERQALLIKCLLRAGMIDMRFATKTLNDLYYQHKYGTSIDLVYWNHSYKTVRTPAKNGMPSAVSKVLAHDHADMESIYPGDFYPSDTRKQDVNSMDFVGRRITTTLASLKRLAYGVDDTGMATGYYHNLDLLSKVNSGNETEGSSTDANELTQKPTRLGQNVECMEYWFTAGLFDPNSDPNVSDEDVVDFCLKYGCEPEDLPGPWVITMADGNVPIRIQPNPYPTQEFPFVVARCFEEDDKFWGIGIGKLIESDMYEIADKHNQAMDAASAAIRSVYFSHKSVIKRVGNKKLDDVIEPGEIVELDVPNGTPINQAIAEFRSTVNPLIPLQAADTVLLGLQRRTGATNTLAGVETPHGQTATEIQNSTSGALARVGVRAARLEETWVKPLLQAFYQLYCFYFDETKAIRVAGEQGLEWEDVSPDDLVADVRFNPKGSRTIANDLARNTQLLQLTAQPMVLPYLRMNEVVQEFFRGLGYDNPTRFYQDPNRPQIPVQIEDQHKLFAEGHRSPVDPMQPLMDSFMEVLAHGQYLQMVRDVTEADRIREHMTEHDYFNNLKMQQLQTEAQTAMMGAQQEQSAEGGNPGQTQAPYQPESLTGVTAPTTGGLGRAV